MNNTSRVIATFFVWAAFTLIAPLVIGIGEMTSFMALAALVVSALAAVFSTRYIWTNQIHPVEYTLQSMEKNKRDPRERLGQLVMSLDDDEAKALLNDLRVQRLQKSDGELGSLEALLAERGQERRSSQG